MSIQNLLNIDDSKIKPNFIYGELFELATYIGIITVCKSKNIPVLGYSQTFESINIDPSSYLDFEEEIEKVYGQSYEKLKSTIVNLGPINTSISIPDFIPEHQDELIDIIKIAIERNVKDRQSYLDISDKDKSETLSEMLNHPNDMNSVLLLSSGYSTGIHFVEWCLQKFGEGFSIIIETDLFSENLEYPKKPDIIVINKSKVVLIGDVKSYYPFIEKSRTNLLKDVLDQIPLLGLTNEFFDNSAMAPKNMQLHVFVRRFNVLLRYFKLLKYMEIVYENGDDEFKHGSLNGLILFPTKPVPLRTENVKMISKFRKTLRKSLPYIIRGYDKSSRKYIYYNIRKEVWENEKVDLDNELEEGNLYIESVRDENGIIHYICKISQQGLNEPYYFQIGQPSDFQKGTTRTKNDVIKKQSPGWSSKSIKEIQNSHSKYFKTKLLEMKHRKGTKLSILINASDQGTGKNYSFAQYLCDLIKKNINRNILITCPRKEALIETILALNKHLSFMKQPIHKEIAELIETGSFESESLNIKYIQSGYKQSRTISKQGWLKKINDLSGESATTRFNQFLKEGEKKGITIVFLIAQALPYITQQKRRNLPIITNFKNIYDAFDLIVFDELTNSDPLVRETFIDFIRAFQELKDRKSSRILVMDASITSPSLFVSCLDELAGKRKEFFYPFWEEVKKYENNPIIDEISLPIDVDITYFRFQSNFELTYAGSSIGWEVNDNSFPYTQIIKEINEIISKTRITDPSFPSLDSLLTNGQVIFYIDNKFLIYELNGRLREKGYPVAISIAEQKDRESYLGHNILGTNSLAYGTSFPDKRLIIILPRSKGFDFFQYRQNIELIRQVTKRMRGQEYEPHRLVCLFTFPTEIKDMTLEENVNMSFFMLKNGLNEFITQKSYHQLPSFSSRFNSLNWMKNTPEIGNQIYDSIYSVKTFQYEKEVNLSLEEYLNDTLPKLRVILNRWGLGVNETFQIGFDAEKIIRIPTPSYLCFPLDTQSFSRFLNIEIFLQKGTESLELLKKYLKKPFEIIEKDLEFFYNLCRIRDSKVKSPGQEGLRVLLGLLNKLETSEPDLKRRSRLFITELNSILRINTLPLSGTAFLLTFELGVKPGQMFGKGINIYQARRIEKREYLKILWEIGSPLKSLYYGASDYFETPIVVKFANKDVQTVGFLCHYPNFHNYHHTQLVYQLIKKCLIRELFRENVIYLPNLLKDLWQDDSYD